jgi:hypothetical protein
MSPNAEPLTKEFQRILSEQRGQGFPALAGTNVRFSIPLRENVVNAILAADRAKKESEGKRTPDIRLSLIDGGIEAKNLPVVGSLAFTLPEQIDFPDDPILRLTPRGFLGRLIGGVIGALGIAPDFVRVESGQVCVDLGRYTASIEYGDLISFVGSVRLHSLPGVIWLEGEMKVQ